MTIWTTLLIISILGIGIFWYVNHQLEYDNFACVVFFVIFIGAGFVSIIVAPIQYIKLNKEQIRQTKEREQILYQVEHLSEGKDKIKLNEWILTYNDWVNDVNTEKETFGWFAWHSNFDMSKHQIIDLV